MFCQRLKLMIFIISIHFHQSRIFSLEIKLTGFSWQMQCQCLPGLLNFEDPGSSQAPHHVILFYLIRIFTWKLWSTVDLYSGSSHLHPRIFIKCHYTLFFSDNFCTGRKFYSWVQYRNYWATYQIELLQYVLKSCTWLLNFILFYRWIHQDDINSPGHTWMACTHMEALYGGHTCKHWIHLEWTHLYTPGMDTPGWHLPTWMV